MKRMCLLISADEKETLRSYTADERDLRIVALSGLQKSELLRRMNENQAEALHIFVASAPFFTRLQETARA